MVQCRTATAEGQDQLRAIVAGAVRRAAGVECAVVLAPTRSLTFTTSGKLSRAAVKADYLSGAIRDMSASLAELPLEQLAVAS